MTVLRPPHKSAHVGPLLSRSLLVQLEPLDDEAIRTVINRSVSSQRGLAGRIRIDDGEIGVLSGRGNEQHCSVFDGREKRILLGF